MHIEIILFFEESIFSLYGQSKLSYQSVYSVSDLSVNAELFIAKNAKMATFFGHQKPKLITICRFRVIIINNKFSHFDCAVCNRQKPTISPFDRPYYAVMFSVYCLV